MDFSVGSEMAEALSVTREKPSEPDHSTWSLNKYVDRIDVPTVVYHGI